MKKIAVLVSGGGSNLQAIIDAVKAGDLNVIIACVGADNPNAGGLTRAREAGIPTFVTDYRALYNSYAQGAMPPADFSLEEVFEKQGLVKAETSEKVKGFLERRALAEADLLNELSFFDVDLLVLAGFMRVLTPYFIDRFNGGASLPRIMNIHPALLPSFPGTDGYGDTFGYGCKVGGCTVHFVDYGEDSGPIIGQAAFSIGPEDDLATVKRHGLAEEWKLYPECIRLYSEGRLNMGERGGRKVVEVVS